MTLPVKEDLRRIVLSKYFPFLFSLIVVGIVYFNELMSWPLLRFSNVFAGKNFIDLQYVLRRADCYKDISTEVYTYSIEAGWNSCFNYWYGETLLSVLSLLRIGLVDEVHSVAALENRIQELVALLVERSALTQVATKAMIDEVVREGKVKPKTTLYWETEMDKSGEVREGVAAFLAKRPVRWPWKRG